MHIGYIGFMCTTLTLVVLLTMVTIPDKSVCHAVGCTVDGTQTCQNDSVTGNLHCICYTPKYQGEKCADFDECKGGHNVCGNNGMCINTMGSFSCVCLPGLTGAHCKHNTSSNCTLGYKESGGTCVDIDECTLSTTVNTCAHGTCNNAVGSFHCVCQNGWTGIRCHVDENECLNSPCQHGTCNNTIGSYYCACQNGWTGNRCDVDVDECQNNPCGHGTCINTVGSFHCACQNGWNGNQCDVDVDECQNSTCIYGNCTNQIGGFYCTCHGNWTGKLCDVSIVVTASPTAVQTKSPTNIALIVGCVVGGSLTVSGGIVAAILVYRLVFKRQRGVGIDQDTVIEVEQTTSGNRHTEKNGHTVAGIPVDNNDFAMKTRFSIQRLFR